MLALALAGSAAAASAQPVESVPLQLDLHPCLDVDAPAVRRIVGLELMVELNESQAAGRTRVRAFCARDATRIEVDDGVTGKLTTRRVDLEGTARVARSRLLALAIAELVSASWAELRLRPAEDRPVVFEPVAPDAVREVARRVVDRRLDLPTTAPPPGPIRRASRARLFLGGSVGATGRPARFLGGGGADVHVDLSARLTLAFGMELTRGRARTGAGEVQDDRLAWSAALLLRRPWGAWWVAGGIGARMGRARLEGIGAGGRLVSAPFGGAFLVGQTWRPVWRRLLVGARVELGTVTLPVVGRVGAPEGRVAAAVDGPWSTLQLTVAVAL